MKIFVKAATANGRIVFEEGTTYEGKDALEMVEQMRGWNPFTADMPVAGYMKKVLDGVGIDTALPDGDQEAAGAFLAELAKNGLIDIVEGG